MFRYVLFILIFAFVYKSYSVEILPSFGIKFGSPSIYSTSGKKLEPSDNNTDNSYFGIFGGIYIDFSDYKRDKLGAKNFHLLGTKLELNINSFDRVIKQGSNVYDLGITTAEVDIVYKFISKILLAVEIGAGSGISHASITLPSTSKNLASKNYQTLNFFVGIYYTFLGIEYRQYKFNKDFSKMQIISVVLGF